MPLKSAHELVAGTTTLVTYTYDARSRQISRTDEDTGITTWCLYDGWNVMVEYTMEGTDPLELSKTNTWGLDLSGSLQGAGGVGGLLAVTYEEVEGDPLYFTTFDGNGNVSEYLTPNGVVMAHYEYDAFGNDITPPSKKGDKHDEFAYRFSTKPYDGISGWYYYGYRYMDPLTGRWPSRDSIGEEGGENLYGFVRNDGASKWDYLGMEFTGTYSITTKQLKLTDKDRKNKFSRKDNETCECEGSSGDNNFKNIDAKGTGPIPTGPYLVVSAHHNRGGNTTYVLDPIDTKPYNDRWDNHPKDISRNLFRIHIEFPNEPRGGSDGCMVFNENELKALKAFIDLTNVKRTVDMKQTGFKENDEWTASVYGTLEVTQ
jgi:RHS repeat-associated protein